MSYHQPYFGKQALSTHDSPHDSFDSARFRNWLSNSAGIGTYAHGRVHQEVGYTIYVSDLIHKRGHLMTSDILLMEEQQLFSMGEPLSVPSRLGALVALAMLPTMSTSNGEGSLVGYYEHGVVAFATDEVPRESRFDGEGKPLQKGWDSKRMVNHLLNTVSAVGRYAVSLLPRDHFFRSTRGLHFLKTLIGEGSFVTEQINRVSSDVDPLLDQDPVNLLRGSATGFWVNGDRLFATTGMAEDRAKSSSAMGRGMVSLNQAATFTEDRTPIPVWEGLWTFDSNIAGIHMLTDSDTFSAVCSDSSGSIYRAVPDRSLDHDIRDGVELPIEWSFETAQAAPAGLGTLSNINGCSLEFVVSEASQRVRVWVRTDACEEWGLWRDIRLIDKVKSSGQKLLIMEPLGKPPKKYVEGTWVQVKVDGIGPVEFRWIGLDFSPSIGKSGKQQSYGVTPGQSDYFASNTSPTSERWPQQD